MKHAVFFCEKCGKPVPLDAEECPHCGSRFTAVQCPQCSFVGEAHQFLSGCPHCGYLPGNTQARATALATPSAPPAISKDASSTPSSRSVPHAFAGRRSIRSGSSLPKWFYTVASLALLVVLLGLVVIFLTLK